MVEEALAGHTETESEDWAVDKGQREALIKFIWARGMARG